MKHYFRHTGLSSAYSISGILMVLFIWSSTLVHAQCNSVFSDDFSGTLSSWQNTTDWTISSGEMKHNLSGVTGESYVYTDLGSTDFTTGDFEWEVCLRNGNWDPSGNNHFEYVLFSDTNEIGGQANGYSVGVNQTSTSDELSLYKLSFGSHNALITISSTTLDWSENEDICLRITRSSAGTWNLYYNNAGAGEVLAGSSTETTWTTGQYMGLVFTYTTSRAGLLFADDISLCKSTSSGPAIASFEFSDYPGCVVTDSAFSITVCALNGSNEIDTSFNEIADLALIGGTGTLSGTTTLPFSNGCATFSDLSIDQEGAYQLEATYNSISTTSDNLNVGNVCQSFDTLTIMTYNLLNYPDDNICSGGIQLTNREDTLKKILDYVQPDILMVCELQNETGANQILNSSLNHSGTTTYKRANFVTNGSGGGFDLNNMMFYNSEKVTLYKQDRIITTTRDVSKYTIYGNDPFLSSRGDTTFIDLYETHFKAGSDPTDETRRSNDANYIKTYLINNSYGFDILGGDFNLYTDQEQAYKTLCTDAGHPFNDPIQREGAWSANSSFSDVHTQSTRAFGTTSIECGSTGGVDDRFDFLLVSDSLMNENGRVHYLSGTYRALGNNGSTYNESINDPSNTTDVPDEVLNALYYMSDHLPVIMDIAIDYSKGTEDPTSGLAKPISDAQQIIVYPNPSVSGIIHIKTAPLIYAELSVIVRNTLGQIVFRQGIKDTNRGEFSLDLQHLPSGNYLLQLQSREGVYHRRISIKD